LDSGKFSYNTARTAGSSSGVTRTPETRARISAAMFGKSNKPTISVTILDIETNITTTYDSLIQAAKAIESNPSNIFRLTRRQDSAKPFRGRYIITIHREIGELREV
jgi:hypothetical protein